MSGIIGIFAFDELWKVSRFVYYGLLALQHRGQETTGIAIGDGRTLRIHHGKGFVDQVYNEAILDDLTGWYGIGYVGASPDDFQPALVKHDDTRIALVLSGKLFNINKLAKKFEIKKWENQADFLAKAILIEFEKRKDFKEATAEVMKALHGGFSFIAINNMGEMIAARGALGVKPLVVGSFGFDYGVFASESCAIDVIGADLKADVNPGELYYLNQYTVEREQVLNPSPKYCAYEYVYLARPDSRINGVWIHDVRKKIGEFLAENFDIDADVVTGIPDTAIPFALAFSNRTRIPVELGFVATGRKTRTAIKPTQFERLVGVQLKLNPIKPVFRGKKVIIIDDSVVRGTTTKNTVTLLRNRIGAKEIHVLIGSPRIVAQCPYGIEVPSKDELIAAHLTEEEVAKVVGADSFHWLSIEDFIRAVGIPREHLCLKCFGGDEE